MKNEIERQGKLNYKADDKLQISSTYLNFMGGNKALTTIEPKEYDFINRLLLDVSKSRYSEGSEVEGWDEAIVCIRYEEKDLIKFIDTSNKTNKRNYASRNVIAERLKKLLGIVGSISIYTKNDNEKSLLNVDVAFIVHGYTYNIENNGELIIEVNKEAIKRISKLFEDDKGFGQLYLLNSWKLTRVIHKNIFAIICRHLDLIKTRGYAYMNYDTFKYQAGLKKQNNQVPNYIEPGINDANKMLKDLDLNQVQLILEYEGNEKSPNSVRIVLKNEESEADVVRSRPL